MENIHTECTVEGKATKENSLWTEDLARLATVFPICDFVALGKIHVVWQLQTAQIIIEDAGAVPRGPAAQAWVIAWCIWIGSCTFFVFGMESQLRLEDLEDLLLALEFRDKCQYAPFLLLPIAIRECKVIAAADAWGKRTANS